MMGYRGGGVRRESVPRLSAVVLAAGSGQRLRSMAEAFHGSPRPKQFCTFGRPRSLLQETLRRLRGLVEPRRTFVVVDRTQRALAAAQVPATTGVRVVQQPCDRGTGTGALLPLLHVLLQDPEATVLLTPSDHAVGDPGLFQHMIRWPALVPRRQRVISSYPSWIL